MESTRTISDLLSAVKALRDEGACHVTVTSGDMSLIAEWPPSQTDVSSSQLPHIHGVPPTTPAPLPDCRHQPRLGICILCGEVMNADEG